MVKITRKMFSLLNEAVGDTLAQSIGNALTIYWTAQIHINHPQAEWLRHEEVAKEVAKDLGKAIGQTITNAFAGVILLGAFVHVFVDLVGWGLSSVIAWMG